MTTKAKPNKVKKKKRISSPVATGMSRASYYTDDASEARRAARKRASRGEPSSFKPVKKDKKYRELQKAIYSKVVHKKK